MNKKNNYHDIFICYESSTGEKYAEHLQKALIKANYCAFLAKTSLRSGNQWRAKIDCEIENCKFFIIIITALTMNSTEVERESALAYKFQKRIIPCRYSYILIPETENLQMLHQIEFSNDSELANKVIIEIRRIINDESQGKLIEEDYKEFMRRGELFDLLGKSDKALDMYDKALAINPNLLEAWNNKALIALQYNDPSKGLKYLDKAIEINNNAYFVLSNKAAILRDVGRLLEALDLINKALNIEPEFVLALNNKGVILIELNDLEQAKQIFIKTTKIAPAYAIAWNNKGLVHGMLNENTIALHDINIAIELNPRLAEAWINKGLIYKNLKECNKQLECIDKAIKINPTFAKAWLVKGMALEDLNETNKAILAYKKSIEINPQYAEAIHKIGILIGNQGKYQESLQFLKKALKLLPVSVGLWRDIALVYSHIGKYKDALYSIEKSINLDPDSSYSYLIKGNILSRHSLIEKAIISYEKAIEIDNKNADAWFRKGYVLGEIEDYYGAIESFRVGLKYKPNDEVTLFNLAINLEKINNFEESKKTILLLLQINSSYPEANSFLGYLYYKEGKYLEAIKIFDNLFKQSDSATIPYYLSCIHSKLGNYKKSLKYLEEAIKLEPKLKDTAKTDNELNDLHSISEYKKLIS